MTWNWQHIISFYYRVAVSFQILEEAVQDDKIIYCQCLLLRFIINWKRSLVIVFKKQTRINKEQEQHRLVRRTPHPTSISLTPDHPLQRKKQIRDVC